MLDFLASCEHGMPGPEMKDSMRQRAHSFVGSGATYGFNGISDAAKELEVELDPNLKTGSNRLADLTRVLLGACDRAMASPIAMGDTTTVSEAPIPPDVNRPLLLIVDDDPAMTAILSASLKNDAEITVVTDGHAALDSIRARRPDLVLLDDNMPGMSGMTVMELLQLDPVYRTIPIIMLTAGDNPHTVMRAMTAGVLDYIRKPFDPPVLAGKVRTMLQRSGTTLLIADDDPSIRDLLAYKFRMSGVRVQIASDGEAALELAIKHKPRIAILDQMMPGLNGTAVLQKLREHENTRNMPVIFLTAKRREQDILEGFRMGVADYIVKPFLPEEVVARCFRVLGFSESKKA